MDQHASRLWDEMLDEFRALGGTAENICLKCGRYGRGLFPRDPLKPTRVRIPDSLLMESKHVRIENGVFRVASEAPIGAREKKFLERYQRDFSWGVSRQETEALLQLFQDAPVELREFLKTRLHLDAWLEGPTPEAVRERFFASRVIDYRQRTVVMPIVELANHGPATRYELEDGVGLSGRFDDEILVTYSDGDPLSIFKAWGFVSDSSTFALSLSFGFPQEGLLIERRTPAAEEGRNPFYPRVRREGGRLVLSHTLLGHKQYPRLPRGLFYRALQEAGRPDAAELFDRIQHVNRMQFLRLISLCESAGPPLGRLLRDLASAQLETMSHNFGTREV